MFGILMLLFVCLQLFFLIFIVTVLSGTPLYFSKFLFSPCYKMFCLRYLCSVIVFSARSSYEDSFWAHRKLIKYEFLSCIFQKNFDWLISSHQTPIPQSGMRVHLSFLNKQSLSDRFILLISFSDAQRPFFSRSSVKWSSACTWNNVVQLSYYVELHYHSSGL